MTDKKHILVVSQYFYPEQFRINDICQEWVKRGYKVTRSLAPQGTESKICALESAEDFTPTRNKNWLSIAAASRISTISPS